MNNIIYSPGSGKIEYPKISKQEYLKDFSTGFYATFSKEEAEMNAQLYNTPFVNMYKVNRMNSLNIKIFNQYSEEWLDFVISCRLGIPHSYDIVIGPKANDILNDYIEAYQCKMLNTKKLLNEFSESYSNSQISINTARALNCLTYYDGYSL